jgi:hypothetical protein
MDYHSYKSHRTFPGAKSRRYAAIRRRPARAKLKSRRIDSHVVQVLQTVHMEMHYRCGVMDLKLALFQTRAPQDKQRFNRDKDNVK